MSDRTLATVPERAAFTAMVWKELREHRVSGVAGFLIVMVGSVVPQIVRQAAQSPDFALAGSSPVSLFTLTSALAALIIGRAVVARETRGDRWGFLAQRPVRRSTMFLAKAAAGALLYVVATAVPLVCTMVWAGTPGHRAMPYDPRMALPDVADTLNGVVFLFAAMLMSIRDARWFGSRVLPVGWAVICLTFVGIVGDFWQAAAIAGAGALVIGTAAWGAFIGGGRYESQPRLSRAAAGVSVGSGLVVVALVAYAVLTIFAESRIPADGNTSAKQYALTRDGTIVQLLAAFRPARSSWDVVAVNDLEGRPIARYQDSASRANLADGVISMASLPMSVNSEYARVYRNGGYRGTGDFFVPLGTHPSGSASAAAWYYVHRLGLIAAYDVTSARVAGWIGPDGFSAGGVKPSHRFEGPLGPSTEGAYPQSLMAFPSAVYSLDFPRGGIQRIFTPPPGESVVAAATTTGPMVSSVAMASDGSRVSISSQRFSTVRAERLKDGVTAIMTTRSVYVLSSDSGAQLAAPRDPMATNDDAVTVSRALLAPGKPTFIWYRPAFGQSPERAPARPERVIELDTASHVLAQFTLPPDVSPPSPVNWTEVAAAAATTPLVERAASRLFPGLFGDIESSLSRVRSVQWIITIVTALLCGAVNFGVGRVYAFARNRLSVWTAAGVLLGPIGVLLMLSLIEWPARETCPGCARRRVVTRERCEHCGAPFAPPPADGTEIFGFALVSGT